MLNYCDTDICEIEKLIRPTKSQPKITLHYKTSLPVAVKNNELIFFFLNLGSDFPEASCLLSCLK